MDDYFLYMYRDRVLDIAVSFTGPNLPDWYRVIHVAVHFGIFSEKKIQCDRVIDC